MSAFVSLKHFLRKTLQWAWVCTLQGTGCLSLAKHMLRRRGAIVVLTFHRVLDDNEVRLTNSPSGMVVNASTYSRLCSYLRKEYSPIALNDATPGAHRAKLAILATFDDGWSDNLEVGAPIARSYGIPLTIFICTELMGRITPFWPERVLAAKRAMRQAGDEEQLLSQLKSLSGRERELQIAELESGTTVQPASQIDRTFTWREARAAISEGVTLGSHTATHEILTNLEAADIEREVALSRQHLTERLGVDCAAISYPNGNSNADVREIAASAGYTLGFTTRRGAWVKETESLDIPRCNVYEGNLVDPFGKFSPAMFEYTTIWSAWRGTTSDSGEPRRLYRTLTPPVGGRV